MTQDGPDRLSRELLLRAILAGVPGESVPRLADTLSPLDVAAGTVLFRRGEAADRFYFVVQGQLDLEDEGHPSWSFGPRSMVGIVDVMTARPRQRSCRAVVDSQLFVARGSAWLDLMEEDPFLGRGAVFNSARQVHQLWLMAVGKGHIQPLQRVSLPAPPLPLYEKILLLRDVGLFRNAGVQSTASLAQLAEELRVAQGERLFASGENTGTIYALGDGVVEVQHGAPELRTVWGAGALVGGGAALCGALADCSASALEDCVLLRFRDEDYYDQAEEHPDLIRAAMVHFVTARESLQRAFPELAAAIPTTAPDR